MKKSLRRLLRRLAKKKTPITGVLRRLEDEGHDFDEKAIRRYYKKKLKASKGSRKRCKHVFNFAQDKHGDQILIYSKSKEAAEEWNSPHDRDEEGLYFYDEEVAEEGEPEEGWTIYLLDPCKYCGMTWAEVKEKRASAGSKPEKKKKKKKKKKKRKRRKDK